MKVINNS